MDKEIEPGTRVRIKKSANLWVDWWGQEATVLGRDTWSLHSHYDWMVWPDSQLTDPQYADKQPGMPGHDANWYGLALHEDEMEVIDSDPTSPVD